MSHVVKIETPQRQLRAIEFGADLSIQEKSETAAHLSVAVAPARTPISLIWGQDCGDPIRIELSDKLETGDLIGHEFSLGTARLKGLSGTCCLTAQPVKPGVIQVGDIIRILPPGLVEPEGSHPFPRIPDGLPDAWVHDDGRFSEIYERRLERLWTLFTEMGYRCECDWAGTEDGEALRVFNEVDECILILDIENPAQQEEIDSEPDLRQWAHNILK